MEHILLALLTAIAVVVAVTPSVITIAKFKNIFDIPGERKPHKNEIPHIGGVAIIAAFLFAYSLWRPSLPDPSFRYILASSLILFLVGIRDDILGLSPLKKLAAQILVSFIVIIDGDGAVRLTGLHGVLNISDVPYWMSIALSLFTFIVIINSFNLIDGIDGLASGLGMIASLAFGFWFFYTNNLIFASMGFALAGALMGMLFFNFSPAKIFIGDCGSLVVGFLLALLAIKFIELNSIPLQQGTYAASINSATYIRDTSLQRFMIPSAPAFAIAVLIVPLYDTLRIFLVRIVNKRSPFQGDTNHIHHRLSFIGFNARMICMILFGVNIFFIAIAYFLKNLNVNVLIGILGLTAVALDFILFLAKRRKTPR